MAKGAPRDLVALSSVRHWATFNDPVANMAFQIIKRVYPQHPPSCTRRRTIEMIAICAAWPRKEDRRISLDRRARTEEDGQEAAGVLASYACRRENGPNALTPVALHSIRD